jgi:putative heme degradation protein
MNAPVAIALLNQAEGRAPVPVPAWTVQVENSGAWVHHHGAWQRLGSADHAGVSMGPPDAGATAWFPAQPVASVAAPRVRLQDVDLLALGDAWCTLRSPLALSQLIASVGLGRQQAWAAMEGVHTHRLPLAALEHIWRLSDEICLPWQFTVGGGQGVLRVQGPLGSVHWQGGCCLLQQQSGHVRTELGLRLDALHELWLVMVPSPEGLRARLEAFDARGGLLLTLASPRQPGEPESAAWRLLVQGLSQGRQACNLRCVRH